MNALGIVRYYLSMVSDTLPYKMSCLLPLVLKHMSREDLPTVTDREMAVACLVFLVKLEPECDFLTTGLFSCQVSGTKPNFVCGSFSDDNDEEGWKRFALMSRASVFPTSTLNFLVGEVMRIVTSVSFPWSPQNLLLADVADILVDRACRPNCRWEIKDQVQKSIVSNLHSNCSELEILGQSLMTFVGMRDTAKVLEPLLKEFKATDGQTSLNLLRIFHDFNHLSSSSNKRSARPAFFCALPSKGRTQRRPPKFGGKRKRMTTATTTTMSSDSKKFKM